MSKFEQGAQAYAMRENGAQWAAVAQELGLGISTAVEAAKRHARREDAPWPIKPGKQPASNPFRGWRLANAQQIAAQLAKIAEHTSCEDTANELRQLGARLILEAMG